MSDSEAVLAENGNNRERRRYTERASIPSSSSQMTAPAGLDQAEPATRRSRGLNT